MRRFEGAIDFASRDKAAIVRGEKPPLGVIVLIGLDGLHAGRDVLFEGLDAAEGAITGRITIGDDEDLAVVGFEAELEDVGDGIDFVFANDFGFLGFLGGGLFSRSFLGGSGFRGRFFFGLFFDLFDRLFFLGLFLRLFGFDFFFRFFDRFFFDLFFDFFFFRFFDHGRSGLLFGLFLNFLFLRFGERSGGFFFNDNLRVREDPKLLRNEIPDEGDEPEQENDDEDAGQGIVPNDLLALGRFGVEIGQDGIDVGAHLSED